MNVIGDVKGKTCILFDDMIDTAGSLCNAANALVEVGGAKEVYACATHGVLSGPAYDRIEKSVIKEVVVHNTIPVPTDCSTRKIKQLDVAPIFARAIAHIHGGTSIADLF
jgi:ribose-phosphate pyrophosphokinase